MPSEPIVDADHPLAVQALKLGGRISPKLTRFEVREDHAGRYDVTAVEPKTGDGRTVYLVVGLVIAVVDLARVGFVVHRFDSHRLFRLLLGWPGLAILLTMFFAAAFVYEIGCYLSEQVPERTAFARLRGTTLELPWNRCTVDLAAARLHTAEVQHASFRALHHSGPTYLLYAQAGDDQRVIAMSPSPRQIEDLRKRLTELARSGGDTSGKR